jgi:hypothetical protein
MVDPDPRVSGHGLKYLKEKGLQAQLIPEPEGELCRDINAPFVFRVLHNRAYAAVWRSISLPKADIVQGNHPGNDLQTQEAERTGNINCHFADYIVYLVREVVPEVSAVMLTAAQLMRIRCNDEDTSSSSGASAHGLASLASLPSHVAAVVVLGNYRDMKKVAQQIHDLRRIEESAAVNRTWIVIADASAESRDLAQLTNLADIKMLSDYSKDRNNEPEIATDTNTDTDTDTVHYDADGVLKVVASSGYNAVLIVADSDTDLLSLNRSFAVQKLVLTAETPSLGSEDDKDSTASGGLSEAGFIESCESSLRSLVDKGVSCGGSSSTIISSNSLRVFIRKLWSQSDSTVVSKDNL